MLAKQLTRTDRLLCLLFVALGGMIGALSLKPQATMAMVGLLLASRFLLLNYKALLLMGVMLIPINQVPFVNLGDSFKLSAVTLALGLFGIMLVLRRQWHAMTITILLFFAYLCIEVVRTAYEYRLGLMLPFKYGIPFFFFLFAFAVCALTPKEEDVWRFLLLTMVTGVCLSVFYILQSFTGSTMWDIFTHQYNILQEGFGYRIFNYAIFTYNFLFLVSMSILMFTKRYRLFFVLCAGVLSVAILANFSRSNYLCVGAGMLIASLYFFKEQISKIKPATILRTVVTGFALFGLLTALDPSIFDTVVERGMSTINDLQNNGGTWKARTSVMGLYWDILQRNPYLGAGFVHPDTGIFSYLPNGGLQNSDLGLLNIVVLMGFIGSALYLLLIVTAVRMAMSGKRADASPLHKAFCFTVFAYLLGGLLSSMTNPILVGVAGILPLSVGIGLMMSTRPRPSKKLLPADKGYVF